jgi:hypothetical protein
MEWREISSDGLEMGCQPDETRSYAECSVGDPDPFAGSGFGSVIFTARSWSGSSSSDIYLLNNCSKKDVLNQFFFYCQDICRHNVKAYRYTLRRYRYMKLIGG